MMSNYETVYRQGFGLSSDMKRQLKKKTKREEKQRVIERLADLGEKEVLERLSRLEEQI
jgi:hypothetical protein